jgi:predicted outer membrane repeat protein
MTLRNGRAEATGNGPLGSGGGIYNTGTLALQNVTLANNRSQTNIIGSDTIHYGGGGIYNFRAALTLDGCTFLSNSTSINGGGVMTTGGTVGITDSTFTGNTAAQDGGGISGNDGASVNLGNSAVNTTINMRYNNTSPRPSALTIGGSTVARVEAYGDTTIANSTTGALVSVERTNVTDSVLGAVSTSSFVSGGALSITRSTLAQLTQQFGSATIKNSIIKAAAAGVRAVTVNQGTTLIENSTITGFDSTGQGTLYFPIGENATIRNSTIAGNQADRGGGIFVASGILKMDSSIVGDNTADTIANDISGYVTGEFNLIEDATGAFLLSANNLSGVDPQLVALANNGGPTLTFALLDGSPAYDAGSNPALLLFDQRGVGFARVVGAGPDIGAWEGQVPEPASAWLGGAAAVAMAAQRRRPRRRQ